MKLEDTRIYVGGLFRCCTGTVGHEYNDPSLKLEIGSESSCKYCKNRFILREKKGNEQHPHWELIED